MRRIQGNVHRAGVRFLSEPPGSIVFMDLVYNRSSLQDDLVVFADRQLAESVSTIHNALAEAKTWGEFRDLMDAEEFRVVWEDNLGFDLDDFDPDEAFDPEDVPGVSDGDYPRWLKGAMAELLPEDLIKQYGAQFASVLNGDFVELPWDKAEEIADDLRRRGHPVELRTDLDLDPT